MCGTDPVAKAIGFDESQVYKTISDPIGATLSGSDKEKWEFAKDPMDINKKREKATNEGIRRSEMARAAASASASTDTYNPYNRLRVNQTAKTNPGLSIPTS